MLWAANKRKAEPMTNKEIADKLEQKLDEVDRRRAELGPKPTTQAHFAFSLCMADLCSFMLAHRSTIMGALRPWA